jgi:uncharacterized membrane protein
MSSGFHVYRHHGSGALAVLALILGVIVIFILIGATELAFQRIGFTRVAVIAILGATFLGSAVNLPLWRVKSIENLLRIEEVQFFWVTYRIPRIAAEVVSTTVAINLGGAIIPSLVSIYLLYRQPSLLAQAAIGVLATAVVVHLVARQVPGVGIATPAFIPPILAALTAYILVPTAPTVVAYVAGTLGTLIGADLTNLGGIAKLGAPVVSIGGAGTFDGVFLSGILAVLLI